MLNTLQQLQESEEFPTRFGGFSPLWQKKKKWFLRKGGWNIRTLPFKSAGNPSPTPVTCSNLSIPHKIGGSLQWWSYNSCCHVWAFTVKLKHASAMSLGTKWRLHVFTWLFWSELRVGPCLDAPGEKGFPWRKRKIIHQIRNSVISAGLLHMIIVDTMT